MRESVWTKRYNFEVEWQMNDTWAPNKEDYKAIEKIANSADDGPILMIKISK